MALRQILKVNREEKTTTVVAGDFNINTWSKEYKNWVEGNELWELSDEPKRKSLKNTKRVPHACVGFSLDIYS